MQMPIDQDGAAEIALRSRGTPRIANRLLRRVRDYAQVRGSGTSTAPPPTRPSPCLKWMRTASTRSTAGCCLPSSRNTMAARRPEHAGRNAGRRRRRARRGVRTVPHSDWISRPHAARPRSHTPCLRALRPDHARPAGPDCFSNQVGAPPHPWHRRGGSLYHWRETTPNTRY
jgi:hypothetical protein